MESSPRMTGRLLLLGWRYRVYRNKTDAASCLLSTIAKIGQPG
jgi:hypothetical protein